MSSRYFKKEFPAPSLGIQARALRESQTPQEAKLWDAIRSRKLAGLKFRRQHQIGPYVGDFYCDDKKLVVEVDGGQHREVDNSINDRERDLMFQTLGLKILRVWNSEVDNDLAAVLEKIVKLAKQD